MSNAEQQQEEERKRRFYAYRALRAARQALVECEKAYKEATSYTDGTTIQIKGEDCHFVVDERDSYSGQITGYCAIWYKGNTYTQISELEELFNDML